MMGRLELRQERALSIQKIEGLSEFPGSERVVKSRVEREAQFAESLEA
jgi:hypothetical protein